MSSQLPNDGDFRAKFYEDIMPKIYDIGAAVVIIGAMFKILNWPGGAFMLGLGLSTEALIFFLGVFKPKDKELNWAKVYPELMEEGFPGEVMIAKTRSTNNSDGSIGEKMDELFAQAKIDGALVGRLGEGMHRLSDSVENLASLPDLVAVTERYTTSVDKASTVLENMHGAHEDALGAVQKLANVSQGTQDYHEQLQHITETLSTLDSAYKKELQDTDLRSRTTNDVYTRIADSMEKMQAASEETEKFETELAQLSGKISSLNNIYGNMLTALKN